MSLTLAPGTARSEKAKLVVSDLHLSRGKWLSDGRRNPLEDFHQDDKFAELLEHYSTGVYAGIEVELIINGDFFDPLAVIPIDKSSRSLRRLEFPIEVEEDAAVRQIATIMEAHPAVFAAIRRFLGRGKRVVLRWGNHDASVVWPRVQEHIRASLAPPTPSQLEFQIEPYVFDRICVDHGHQHEAINHFDESNLFMERETPQGRKRILNLPFGSFFVLGFLNRVKLERRFINQVQPLDVYLRLTLLIDPVFVIVNGLRVAWFFLKMRFITHPMRFARFRKTLRILAEMFHRPDLEAIAEERLCGPGAAEIPYDTLIMGHNHRAATRVFANGRQYINTGTWIPITSLDMSTLGHRILRTYALIEYRDGKPDATLKVWNGTHQASDEFF